MRFTLTQSQHLVSYLTLIGDQHGEVLLVITNNTTMAE